MLKEFRAKFAPTSVKDGIPKGIDVLIDFWIILSAILPAFGAPLGVHLTLWGRPLAHFGLQMGALGASLGSFGGSQGPLGVDLGVLGRLLPPSWSKIGDEMI